MNPVYPGKDVSYIDTKQAQRAAEVAVCDGERLATLAWLAGDGYPAESLDKAWRQLVFGDGKGDVPLLRFVDTVRTDSREIGTKPVWANRTIAHHVERDVDVIEIQQGLKL